MRTIASALGSEAIGNTNDLSIFTSSTGSRCRYESDE